MPLSSPSFPHFLLPPSIPLQHFAFVSIGVDYFQILAMFGNAHVAWPPAILKLFQCVDLSRAMLPIRFHGAVHALLPSP